MRPTPRLFVPLSMLLFVASPLRGDGFDEDFTGKTARLDLYHTGTAQEETYAIDQLRIEGEWSGSQTQLVDTLYLGKYRVEIADDAGRVLYANGFATIFGEWVTTAEAREGTPRTFEEAIRFPEPREPFQITLLERDDANQFQPRWTHSFDPAHRSVDRSAPLARDVVAIELSGSPSTKVDLLFLGDGYTAGERETFLDDVKRLHLALFQEDPFKRRRDDFNTRAIFVAAEASGVTNPRSKTFLRTPLGLSYNALDSDRYMLTTRSRDWRDVASAAPYDYVIFLANDKKYGGGGILNLYCTAAAHSAESAYLVVHEFGHHFAGLADEYYTSSVSYENFQPPGVEPWEPNATALLEGKELKWKKHATTGEIPTRWRKEEHDAASRKFQERRTELRNSGADEAALEALFQEERAFVVSVLEEQRGLVGAFEGALYESRGLYRPSPDCLMFSRNPVGFCAVCAGAIDQVIDTHCQ